jgi:hypothetical protein
MQQAIVENTVSDGISAHVSNKTGQGLIFGQYPRLNANPEPPFVRTFSYKFTIKAKSRFTSIFAAF